MAYHIFGFEKMAYGISGLGQLPIKCLDLEKCLADFWIWKNGLWHFWIWKMAYQISRFRRMAYQVSGYKENAHRIVGFGKMLYPIPGFGGLAHQFTGDVCQVGRQFPRQGSHGCGRSHPTRLLQNSPDYRKC